MSTVCLLGRETLTWDSHFCCISHRAWWLLLGHVATLLPPLKTWEAGTVTHWEVLEACTAACHCCRLGRPVHSSTGRPWEAFAVASRTGRPVPQLQNWEASRDAYWEALGSLYTCLQMWEACTAIYHCETKRLAFAFLVSKQGGTCLEQWVLCSASSKDGDPSRGSTGEF